MRRLFWPAAAALLAVMVATQAVAGDPPRWNLEVEAGPVWQGRNVVQIPNDASGTRFSLVDVAGHGPGSAARLYVTWNISPRHGLRALAAPLTLTEPALLASEVRVAGGTFPAGQATEATYKFNSWRLSYRYRVHHGDRFSAWIGFSAKIRDAKIRLEQSGVAAEKTDVGFATPTW